MKEVISIKDRQRMYSNSIIEYAGVPVFVKTFHDDDDTVTVCCLETGEDHRIVFDLDLMKSPRGQLGYVNLPTVATYCYRLAIRRMKVGICGENFRVSPEPFELRMAQTIEVRNMTRDLCCKELHDTLKGTYPEFQEALNLTGANRNLVAFDRQFAVSHDRKIYYRGNLAGAFPKYANPVVENIVWDKAYEHLRHVVGMRLSLSN